MSEQQRFKVGDIAVHDVSVLQGKVLAVDDRDNYVRLGVWVPAETVKLVLRPVNVPVAPTPDAQPDIQQIRAKRAYERAIPRQFSEITGADSDVLLARIDALDKSLTIAFTAMRAIRDGHPTEAEGLAEDALYEMTVALIPPPSP